MKYTLRYARVPLDDISEWRLSGNPNYGPKKIGRYSAYQGIKTFKNKPAFFASLRDSVEAEGVRNPIVLVSDKGLHCRYGASRLWASRQLHKSSIPAIIADFDGQFDRGVELKTEQQVRAVFVDEPEHIVMEEDDFYYYGLPSGD